MAANPPAKLHKFLAYILGVRPQEFGLVPDADGYVNLKTLLQALAEEAGWKHVRIQHIREIMLTLPDLRIEIDGNRIRALDRSGLPVPEPAPVPPKLLFTAIRRRAYPTVLDHGIRPGAEGQVILAADRGLAERMGRRKDPQPVILTVQTEKALGQGVQFQTQGSELFCTAEVPVGCFQGPPPPKEAPIRSKPESVEPIDPLLILPGSESMRRYLDPQADQKQRTQLKKKKAERQKDRQRSRREKEKRWSE